MLSARYALPLYLILIPVSSQTAWYMWSLQVCTKLASVQFHMLPHASRCQYQLASNALSINNVYDMIMCLPAARVPVQHSMLPDYTVPAPSLSMYHHSTAALALPESWCEHTRAHTLSSVLVLCVACNAALLLTKWSVLSQAAKILSYYNALPIETS
jgi:hypothetical protein